MEKVLTTKHGNLSISQEAITDLVTLAAKEIEGVVLIQQDTPSQIMNFLKGKPQEAIQFQEGSEGLILNLNVTVQNGYKITDIALKIQENIKSSLETMLQIPVSLVNIRIVGIK
ncbi:MAG: Asp23/Gls24 family envelope stress response protein [Tissierellia bacterium]|jgi:uncharacterized alkaline shock family protein YloU|nr:Asp23/Gls24 family envelope stress response protein [Tissierellia bacterium]